MDFSGILLAGGKSTRFGINKIKLEFEGIPLLADQIIKMGFFCTEILISSSKENFPYIAQVLDRMDKYQRMLLNSKSGKIDAVSLSASDESPVSSEYDWKKPDIKIVVDDAKTIETAIRQRAGLIGEKLLDEPTGVDEDGVEPDLDSGLTG